jgi:hypothetical protein
MLPTTSASYTGVDLDDFDQDRISTKSATSHHSRLSSFSLLKRDVRGRGFKPWRTSSSTYLRSHSTKAFWTQLYPQTKSFLDAFWADVRTINWRSSLYRAATISFPVFCIVGLIAIFPAITAKKLWTVNDACQPDSGFSVGYGGYDIWNPSGFFQITLGFGDLSFTLAKAIDVGWDVSHFNRYAY